MIQKSKVLAIIPARKGSKRLPDKNKLILNGKPLISWTIESALASDYIDDIVISTDDSDIKKISQSYDVDVPFLRPKSLSGDKASTLDVIFHSIDYYESVGKFYETIVLLQPTSPLRTTSDVNNAFKLLSLDTHSVVSVSKVDHSPIWCNTLPPNNSLEFFLNKDIIGKRSQELPEYYRLNGAIFIAKTKYIKTNKNFFGKKSKAFIMERQNSIDIDTEIDFKLCQLIMNENN